MVVVEEEERGRNVEAGRRSCAFKDRDNESGLGRPPQTPEFAPYGGGAQLYRNVG